MKRIEGFIFLILLGLFTNLAHAFVVKQIKFQGLHNFSAATVENYLPIKRGQSLAPGKSAQIVQDLYKTGFFDHIDLAREGNTLIIQVTERPTIGQLRITGNSIIPTDKLNTVMRSLDVAEGRIYNPAMLEKIKQSLINQYYQLGRYNATVDVSTVPMPRNRVLVKIDISEGLVAKIRRISIIGNHAFDENTLIKQLPMTTPGLFTFFTQSDRYSEAKLDESSEKLRSFYLDHGYLQFQIKSAQAQVTPDRKSVFVTFVIYEGEPFVIRSYDFEGNLIYPRDEFTKRITFRPGDTFSRQQIIDSERAITKYLGEQGYLFSSVSIRPDVNEKTRDVKLIFDVKPGRRTYVRNITFSDNSRTNDVVLRREMDQLEAAPASTSKLEESKHRLSLLPYIKEVEMSLKPVPGVDDQVDINYKVKEDNSAQASFKVGYSQAYHFILGAGLNQKNFLGTGNTLGINFNRSKYEQFYGIEYTDPYYTPDGISRSINFSASRVDPSAISDLNSGYALTNYDLGMTFGIPIGQEVGTFNRVFLGVDYQNILVHLNGSKTSKQVNEFVNEHGRRYHELDLKVGYSRNSYDRAIFPTRGALQTIFLDTYAPLTSHSVGFFTVNYHGKWYIPLNEQFIFLTRADFGYGNGFNGIGNFPFFKNFYAGGIDSVRGYQPYTLGPQDSNGQAYGGNWLADASLAMIFPNFISESLRTNVFFDAGNVYTSLDITRFGGQSATSGPIRYSVGLAADWITPFGPIQLSLAKPFTHRGDKSEAFQFALGANF